MAIMPERKNTTPEQKQQLDETTRTIVAVIQSHIDEDISLGLSILVSVLSSVAANNSTSLEQARAGLAEIAENASHHLGLHPDWWERGKN
jgi:hypothetical protein